MNASVRDIREWQWAGDHPVFLVHRRYEFWKEKVELEKPDGTKYRKWVQRHRKFTTVIDMNVKDWVTEHHDLMRTPGVFLLCAKERINTTGITQPIAAIILNEEEQAFCNMHVVNLARLDGSAPVKSTRLWGLGKKTYKGATEAVWVFPGGMVVPEADKDSVADLLNKGYL